MVQKSASEHKADLEHILTESFEVDDDVNHDDYSLRDALKQKRICKVHGLISPKIEEFSTWTANCPNDDNSPHVIKLFPDHHQLLESFKR